MTESKARKVVSVRMTNEEHKALCDNAKADSRTPSDYIRIRCCEPKKRVQRRSK